MASALDWGFITLKGLRIQMKTVLNRVSLMFKRVTANVFFLVAMLAGVYSCGGGGNPGEEGGLIGTGIIHGTVSETKALASESVEFKSASGESRILSVVIWVMVSSVMRLRLKRIPPTIFIVILMLFCVTGLQLMIAT